jgi:cyclic dehypoxanthinyl futalosine synthase
MLRLRELQDESQGLPAVASAKTGLPAVASAKAGFTAFITWSYQPEHTELGGFEATGVEYLRTLAMGRIVLDNFDNMQASWVTQGGKVGQLSLAYGANDMGSVMIEENVVRAAGAAFCMDEIEIVRNIENAGFTAKRRNMHYEILGDPVFRERDVPRMLALAVARRDGDTSRPAELASYAARSAAEKRLRRSDLSE